MESRTGRDKQRKSQARKALESLKPSCFPFCGLTHVLQATPRMASVWLLVWSR